MKYRNTVRFGGIAVAMFLSCFTVSVSAQNRNAGEIRGTVLDSSGAAIAGATVAITDTQTGITTTTKAGDTGVYDAPSLEPGVYSVAFSRDGFEKLVRTGIVLHVETITVNGTLRVGSVAQEMTVSSQPELIQTESSERSLVLTTQSVTELPNVGRSWYGLTGLLPGVNPGINGAGPGNGQNASGEGIGVNGTQPYQGNWLVDGGAGTLPVGNNPDLLQVPIEDIAEINFNTSSFGAEYGNGLSAFNVITKSGTNEFHGSAFEFVQNDVLETRNFFAPTATPLRWNEFGGTIGGPIIHDKAFFFFSYQRNPTITYAPTFYTYPTAAMRTGNFSGSPTIYDPTSTTMVNGQAVRTPFAGNSIPADRIDPVAQKIEQYYPQPNLPGVYTNYYTDLANPVTTSTYNFKGDYNASAVNRVSVSGMFVDQPTFTPAPDCPLDCTNQLIHEETGQLTDVWTLSPTRVNEFRFSVAREWGNWSSPDQGEGYPAKIGLPNAAADTFPTIEVGGPQSMSNISGGLAAVLSETDFSTSDSFTIVSGKHTLKLGGEFDKWQDDLGWATMDAGTFDFSGIFTRNPADPTSNGLGYADFLLGLPQTWSANEAIETGGREWNTQLFIQDYYKIRPNLTLNFGVRYLAQSGWSEEHNRIASFDPNLINPATNTPGALWFAGEDGRTALEKTVPAFFLPRVGFAWSPKDNWSIRGGYGLFNVPWSSNGYASGLGTGWTIQGYQTSTDLLTPIFTLSQGAPSPIVPTAAQRTPDLLNGQGVSYVPYNTPIGYVEEWQFDIQHQLAGGYLVDAAYVGSRGVHLGFGTDINQVPADLLGVGNAQNNRAYPQYAGISAALWDGFSLYNSLQLSARKQFSHGLSFQANYTYSKSMDTGSATGWNGTQNIDHWQISNDPQINYGPSSFDITQMLNGSVIYDIPVGKGRRFLDRGGIADAIIGGWQISSVFQLHSGLPFTPVMGTANLSNSLAGNWYPNRIANGSLANPTILGWFDTSAFVQPAPNTFGNSGRDILRGPGFANVDLSLAKTFSITERIKLQFRADAQDFLNHPNFGQPNANIGTAGAATISSALTNRSIQLGGVLRF